MIMVKSAAILAVVLGATSLVGCGQGADGTASSASGNALSASDDAGAPLPWCHDSLEATDGTSIRFDYQPSETKGGDPNDPTWTGTASNEWLNVANDSFDGSESVNVTVVDFWFLTKGAGLGGQEGTYVVNLTWDAANNRFTGPLPQPLTMSTYVEGDDEITLHQFQFATEVNGTWLTDPVSGEHNFSYTPSSQSSGQCTGEDIPE